MKLNKRSESAADQAEIARLREQVAKLEREKSDTQRFMDGVRNEARNRNPKGATILDFMACWNEQYERQIGDLRRRVDELEQRIMAAHHEAFSDPAYVFVDARMTLDLLVGDLKATRSERDNLRRQLDETATSYREAATGLQRQLVEARTQLDAAATAKPPYNMLAGRKLTLTYPTPKDAAKGASK